METRVRGIRAEMLPPEPHAFLQADVLEGSRGSEWSAEEAGACLSLWFLARVRVPCHAPSSGEVHTGLDREAVPLCQYSRRCCSV